MRALRQLRNPSLYQGKPGSSSYFEGWYFKQVTADFSRSLAVIPGISLSEDPHAFIQTLDTLTGQSAYHRFPVDSFEASTRTFSVSIAENRFSDRFLSIRLPGLEADLEFNGPVRWPWRPWAPGIMGWYRYVPSMECYHGVVSVSHRVTGVVRQGNQRIDYRDGRGYIEKDWGTAFPESWIWLQANTFPEPEVSLMLSIARIPWRGHWFPGFLGFLYAGGILHRFATYNGAHVTDLRQGGRMLDIQLERKPWRMHIQAEQNNTGGLKAPVAGRMDRMIHESIDSSLSVRLSRTDKIIYEGRTQHAGVEMMGSLNELSEALKS